MEKYRTKIGQFMYDITDKITKVLFKQKWAYYFLHFTWGLIMNIIACLVVCILFFINLFTKNIKFRKNYGMLEIRLLKNWGGCNLGLVYLRDITSNESISSHEIGHSYQVWLGIFFPFIVAIPSAVRWWIRRLQPNKQHKPYDAIWFEASATDSGKYIVKNGK